MTSENSSAQQPRNDDNEPAPAPAPHDDAPTADGNSGNHVRTTLRTLSSIHSFHSTTQIIRSGGGVSFHSTHSSVELEIADAPDEDILSIQTSIEQVAVASQGSPHTPPVGARASFNSISDALGNLRSRLQQAHHQQRERPSSSRSSWIQRLQDRLHVLDAAHLSHVPLHLMESRRRSDNTGIIDQAAEESKNSDERRIPTISARSLHLSAAIFHIDTRGATIVGDAAGDQTMSDAAVDSRATDTTADQTTSNTVPADRGTGDDRPTSVRVRTSLLFASRTLANRSIMEGTSNLLLASGGDGASISRRSLLGDRVLGGAGSLRDLDMHVHPSVRTFLSPIADSNVGRNQTTETIDKEDDLMEVEPRDEVVINVKKRLFQVETDKQSLHDESESSKEELKTAHVTQEKVAMEVEPAPGVKDGSNILYSWGRGEQSLHDDSNERILLADDDEKKTVEMIRVSSRLQSKSILAIATGQNHSACATSQGTLYIVGKNVHGCVDPNCPEGNVISRPVLLDCISHIRVLKVSCGLDHTAALSSNGSVLTWGSNFYGQLGHRVSGVQSTDFQGPTNCRPMGMVLGQGRRASSIDCGTSYTLVLTEYFAVLACGIASIAGHRDAQNWGVPQEIPSLIGLPLIGMSAGDGHASVVTAHGTAYIWGENRNGCCARAFPETMSLPIPVKASSPSSHSDDVAIVHVACGMEHSVFVTKSGHLLVCGSNYRGQLGIPASELPSTSALVQVRHPKGGSFVSAEAGNSHSLVLDTAGDMWVTNTNGLQCILHEKSVLALAAGGDNCIAITSAPDGLKTLQRQFSMEMPENRKSLVDEMNELIEDMEFDDTRRKLAGQEIAQKLEELLRYPSLLNFILNPIKLEQMFERCICASDVETKQIMANSIERGMKDGLQSLRGSRMIYPEAVRCLLSYIKFFDIRRDDSVVFDVRGEAIFLFCDTILGVPFEGYNALHDFATNLYPRELFVNMLVKPLLLTLNACTKFTVDENEVEHFEPSRRSVPVLVAVLSWLYAMAQEAGLADPKDFYSDGVSKINLETLFNDLYKMKKASPHERNRSFHICAHPFLLSPGCKRNLLQMESQVEMFKAMMGDVEFRASTLQYTVEPFFPLEIEREHLVKQTLEIIKQANPKDIRKRLRVSFKGEPGLDAGGVTKEFFQLLSEELFDVETSGLWSKKYGDEINWFNPSNNWDENGYEMIGVLFGLAVYNSVLLDVRFPLAVYRKILGLPLGLEDIMDEELRRGLKQLLDYQGDDVEDVFCLTFELTWTEMGETRRVELKPDGANIPVTKANSEEYVLRYVRWVLVDSIKSQWERFQIGLMRVMEDSSLDLFLPEELELLVVGIPDLDFGALEKNTKYEGGYDESAEVVKNFWKFVRELNSENQAKLLKFTTASSKAPIGGLGNMNFIIQRAGPDSANLPTSHTCFNTLLLPDYGEDYNKLKNLLGRAIMECEGFGLE